MPSNTTMVNESSAADAGPDDLARQQIDAQIAAHEAAIIRLKTKRNELTRISCLPPEVLCKVFLACTEQQGSRSFTIGTSRYSKVSHWSGLTHVCKYWREVGLSCPELWSNITFSSSAWASAMLERSKQVPISVTIRTGLSTKAEPVIVETLSQVSRFKSLTIYDTSAFIQAQLKNMIGEAPCLERLQLNSSEYSSVIPPTLPADFLAGGSARLRRVSISGLQATWSSPFLQGLTSLVWRIPSQMLLTRSSQLAAKSSSIDFVSALKNMPMLEELDLDNTFPTFSALEDKPAPLGHLKKLYLTGRAQQCTGALNCMVLPPSAILEISCDFSGGDSTVEVPAFLSALHSSWISNPLNTPNPLPPFASLQILHEGGSHPILRLFVQDVDFTVWTERPTAALSLTVREAYNDMAPSVSQITSHLPLNNLRSLYLSQPNASFVQFSQLPALQSIALSNSTTTPFVAFLKQDPVFRSIKQLKRNAELSKLTTRFAVTYFPALKWLKLSDVNFVSDNHSYSDDELDVEDLLDVMMWRYEHGGEIERLSLEGCYDLWAEDVARIREVVVDVDWDEVEEERYDSEEDEDDCEDSDDYAGHHFGCACGINHYGYDY